MQISRWLNFTEVDAARTLVKSVYQKTNFLISQPKHVVGTQKNRLDEMVLLSTRNMLKLISNILVVIF